MINDRDDGLFLILSCHEIIHRQACCTLNPAPFRSYAIILSCLRSKRLSEYITKMTSLARRTYAFDAANHSV